MIYQWLMLILITTALLPTNSYAQDQNPSDWFRNHTQQSRAFDLTPGFYLEFIEFEHSYITEQDVLIASKDKSDEDQITRLDSLFANKGEGRKYRLWYHSENQWRICTDMPQQPDGKQYRDIATNSDKSWLMTPYTLHLSSPDLIESDNQSMNTQFFLESLRPILFQMKYGLYPSPGLDYTITSVSSDELGTHTLRTEIDNKLVPIVSFTLEPSNDQEGFVITRNEGELANSEESKSGIGLTNTFSDWKPSPIAQGSIAHTFVMYDYDKPFRTYTITKIEPLETDIEEYVKTPTIDTPDIIRGATTYISVMNHTENESLTLAENDRESILETNPIRSRKDPLDISVFGYLAIVSVAAIALSIALKLKGNQK
jgi:hypothetical protein